MERSVKVEARPVSLIFTLFGDFVERQEGDRSLWIGALIELMRPLGISPAAVRQAVSRMARQGWLRSERRGPKAFYGVTERGRRRIEELGPRIYGPVIEWDGRWRLLIYTVPESARKQRERLRQELALLGWARLAASTWISPRDSLAAAREAAGAAGTLGAVQLFSGEYAGPLGDRDLVERCWDLEAIARAYRAFIERYEALLERERRTHALTEEAAFVERLRLVHAFRKFAYLDPGLPSVLVPAHWPGTSAAAIFREYYAILEAKSRRYFRRITLGSA